MHKAYLKLQNTVAMVVTIESADSFKAWILLKIRLKYSINGIGYHFGLELC